MNDRQTHILAAVIRHYIETAQPVSSKCIVENFAFNVSPATVRNDMAALEDAGFLRQPHTSSGRIPTEEGYRYYLELLHRPARIKKRHAQLIQAREVEDKKDRMREVAKALVKLSGETAMATMGQDWRYYTGFSELFNKPDFNDVSELRDLSAVVDRFDEVMRGYFKEAKSDMNIWIGSENPFSQKMATVMVKYTLPNGMTGMVGLTGPLRMDYQKNMRLLAETKRLLEE